MANQKKKQIKFFVSEEWHEHLAKDAIYNKATLSDYVRSHLPGKTEIDAARSIPLNVKLAESVTVLAALRQELKHIGNNINQSTKVLNSHLLHNRELPTQLDMRGDLAQLDQTINRLSREIRSIGQELLNQ